MSGYDGHASKKLRTNFEGPGVQSGSRDRFDDRDRKSDEDHKQEPSPVVHVRSLHQSCIESDVWDVLGRYGKIVNVFMMNRKHQALVEFDSMDSAIDLVRGAQTNSIYINNHPALFNFSKSSKIDVPARTNDREVTNGATGATGDSRRRPEHNIILVTIMKPLYPITVEVMHTICKAFGEVDRIVIFRKSVLQSMVEFNRMEDAVKAKRELQGADVYSGCCTLKIEFAKPTKLNVYRNDSESWDFTNPNVGRAENTQERARPLLADPDGMGPPRPFSKDGTQAQGGGIGGFGGGAMGGGGGGAMSGAMSPRGYDGAYDMFGSGGGGGRMQMDMDDRGMGRQDRWMDRGNADMGRGMRGGGYDDMRSSSGRGYGMDMDGPMGGGDRGGSSRDRGFNGPQMALLGSGQGLAGGNATPQQNCVLMFYGMNERKMNCERLFNLLCLYGNVIRVKFLKSKDGAAMVQMGDAAACERVIQYLHNMTCFGKRFQITHSKQSFLQDQNNPGDLKDGTCAFIDYMGNKNNRFTTPEFAAKNRILPPCEILHYFNAPPNMEEDEIVRELVDAGCVKPDKIKVFPAKSKRNSSGLLQWENKCDSTDAICLCNHLQVKPLNKPAAEDAEDDEAKEEKQQRRGGRKGTPYTLRLCFSAAPVV